MSRTRSRVHRHQLADLRNRAANQLMSLPPGEHRDALLGIAVVAAVNKSWKDPANLTTTPQALRAELRQLESQYPRSGQVVGGRAVNAVVESQLPMTGATPQVVDAEPASQPSQPNMPPDFYAADNWNDLYLMD